MINASSVSWEFLRKTVIKSYKCWIHLVTFPEWSLEPQPASHPSLKPYLASQPPAVLQANPMILCSHDITIAVTRKHITFPVSCEIQNLGCVNKHTSKQSEHKPWWPFSTHTADWGVRFSHTPPASLEEIGNSY